MPKLIETVRYDCGLRSPAARLQAGQIIDCPGRRTPRAQAQLPYGLQRLRLFNIAANSLGRILGGGLEAVAGCVEAVAFPPRGEERIGSRLQAKTLHVEGGLWSLATHIDEVSRNN